MIGDRGAILSECGTHRYRLWRIWDASKPRALWIMLNPSTADASKDDPTIRKCIGFAKRWNCGSIEVVNLFSFRATNPKELYANRERLNDDLSDGYILAALQGASLVVCAWGSEEIAQERGEDVVEALRPYFLFAVKLSKYGHPYHPLYVPYGNPVIWKEAS